MDCGNRYLCSESSVGFDKMKKKTKGVCENQAFGRKIRDVWANNVDEEMLLLSRVLDTHRLVAFDTEFPGFLHPSPKDSSEEQRYETLVLNVNELKLIQIGITLFNEKGSIGGCWEFNFCDFDIDKDPYVLESINLLRENGIDCIKNRKDGVDSTTFVGIFNEIIGMRSGLRWVTFHGIYDVAYLSKMLMRRNIPSLDYGEFILMMSNAMRGEIYDVKLMAEHYLGEEKCFGLEKLSRMLSVERVGEAHQAGSDSLLTAQLFTKLSQGPYRFIHRVFGGYLFGVAPRIDNRPWDRVAAELQQQRYMLQQFHQFVPPRCYEFFNRQYCDKLGRRPPIFVPVVRYIPVQYPVIRYRGWRPMNHCNLPVY